MLEKYYISKKDYTDLNVYRCGIEECLPGHSWGPGVRDHFIIHIIHKGKGNFTVNDKTYKLEEGQGFLICPGQIVQYEADMNMPWTYSWVGFHGLKAETILKSAGLSPEKSVFVCSSDSYRVKMKNTLNDMIAELREENVSELMLAGYLYLFLSYLVKDQKQNISVHRNFKNTNLYVSKAIEYIEKNYARQITVEEVAKAVNIDRSYLSSLFNKFLGIPPRDFIINYRMDKACELLKNPRLNVGDVARSVGYEDPFQFSKTFKKTKGLPPSKYRDSFLSAPQ
ncbi:MAG: AraC family transcriptional regulator [Clostridiaceae bacterium]|nr:AraC family transcriptional regulator [Clostridiaceae bacterium]